MPPIRQRDPLPDSGSFDGFSPAISEGCAKCNLVVARGISASGAKLYREQGTISYKECGLFKADSQKVERKEMAFSEFKTKLLAGKYFNEQDNGFCSQLMFDTADIQNVNAINEIPWGKARVPSIRKLTAGGGFSSITKLFIKPAIPFNVSFNGETVTVATMTVFHPCPIRIENIQYDAVLTLGDVADASSKTIIMIPLKGALSAGPSGQFMGKIASYIPGILMPNPASGVYEPIDVPTGKDWDLSKVFPGTPSGNSTVVDVPYFVWNSMPPLEMYLRETVQSPMWLPNIEKYGWRPTSQASTKFIMLKDAVPVNSFDLQTIRMLPATPSDEAIPPPYMKSLLFKPAASCDANREHFSMGDVCDPLANIPAPAGSSIRGDTVLAIVLGIISTLAVFIGIYFAMKYATGPTGSKFKEWGEKFGKMLSGMGRKAPVPTFTSPFDDQFEVENPLVAAKKEEERKRSQTEELERAAKAVFDEQEAKKKELKDKMSDTSLSEEEQRRIRKEYQKLTGMYHPTKKEQEAAAGTGLVKRRIIAPEPEDEVEEAKSAVEEVKKTEEQLKTEEAAAKKEAEEQMKKRLEEAKEKALQRVREARERAAASGEKKDSKLQSLLAQAKQKGDEDLEKRKTEANDKIEEIKQRYLKKYEQTGEDKEKAARDLAAAQARLRSSMAQYRRGQQGRNIYSGQARRKTARN